MPLLELSDAELSTAATACRAMAYQEGERAKRIIPDPDVVPAGARTDIPSAGVFVSVRQHIAAAALRVAQLPGEQAIALCTEPNPGSSNRGRLSSAN